MKVFIVTVLLVGSVIAAGDKKDAPKSKRGYSLGYGYSPYDNYVDHEVIDHAPVASAIVHHAPVATVHHAPVVAAAPLIAHAPVVAHAPIVSAIAPVAKVTSSVVSTNVNHYPSTYSGYSAYPSAYSSYVAPHAPIVASSPYYHAPAVASSYYSAPAVASSYYHGPAVASSYYHAPAALVAPAAYSHSPLYSTYHRR